MSHIEKRVEINKIIQSQLPEFLVTEFPKSIEFFKQYYISQEYQGGNVDIVNNLDQYLKFDNISTDILRSSTELTADISESSTIINVSSTKGFPSEYGILKINNEIITYTEKTENSFIGCIRGFSGTTSYETTIEDYILNSNKQQIVFSTSNAESHNQNDTVENLSSLFLKEFYKKLKTTFLPGFENVDFTSNLNIGNFVRGAKSFYQSKGTEESIKILFKILYGVDAQVLDLEKFLIKPSSADYIRRKIVVAEYISGPDPSGLIGKTLFKSTDENTNASVSEVEIFTRKDISYYKISLFVGFSDRDLIQGTFNVTGKTKVTENVSAGSSIISVDSTIGFADSFGGLYLASDLNNQIKYESKSINQFFGCSGILYDIPEGSDIRSDEVYYGYVDGEKVELRITGVLSELEIDKNIELIEEGEKITVKNLGTYVENPETEKTYEQVFANSWIYNVRTRYQISSINSNVFKLSSPIDKSSLKVGDYVDILLRESGNIVTQNALVSSVNISSNEITLNNISTFSPNQFSKYDIRRNLKKSRSSAVGIVDGNEKYISDVLNVYIDKENNTGYVASNSLPSYDIEKNIIESTIPDASSPYITEYNPDTNLYSVISFDTDVSFIDGDSIIYTSSGQSMPGLVEGETYYVKKYSSNKIYLYLSRSSLNSSNYVEFGQLPGSGQHKFTFKNQKNRLLDKNKILRKFPLETNLTSNNVESRGIRNIGILVDGVQIYSPNSSDRIYYGPLEELSVLNGGEDYDVINPPHINISSGIGSQAYAEPIISGSVKNVFIDPHDFDIDDITSVTITGGNGSGCVLSPVVSDRIREISFDSRDIFFGGGIDFNDDTITFLSDHGLKDGELITYNQNGNSPINIGDYGSSIKTGTLASGDQYYAKVINSRTIRLFNSQSDYNLGISTVGITSSSEFGGIHKFRTQSKKTFSYIKVIDPGSGYQYRKLRVGSSGISTYSDKIVYTNHGFNDGDLVVYQAEGSPISGLSTANQYYILKVDDNSFRLSNAGTDGSINANYERKKYEKLNDTGNGYQIFKYPDISVSVVGTSIGGSFNITPIITGSITGSYLYDGGSGYGSEILNLHSKPNISISFGRQAELNPIIVEGSIVSVQVLNGGYEYFSTPDVEVIGDGSGAILRPVILNGKVIDVIIINGGIGYTQSNTTILVRSRGSGAVFDPKVRSLTLDNTKRYKGIVLIKNLEQSLSYNILGYNEDLAKNVYFDDGTKHSPIIGWAYDGNPIYGPYAYTDPDNNQSTIKLLSSSYSLNISNVKDRPTSFPIGFFIDDYVYDGSGDLDVHNGRFCKTPEFPNGIYAYFATVDFNPLTGKLDASYPYFIGDTFRSEFISENLTLNQSFDFNNSKLLRNTFPYKVSDQYAGNDFLVESNEEIIQTSEVISLEKGNIIDIEIIDGGQNYKVNDIINFDDTGTNGTGLEALVSRVDGKEILNIETTIDSYENVVLTWNNDQTVSAYYDSGSGFFDLNEGDYCSVSSISTTISNLSGYFSVGIRTGYVGLAKTISVNSNPNGAYEDIYLNTIPESISIGSSIKIEDEYLRVLNIYPINSVLKVKRFGTGPSYPYGSFVYPLDNRVTLSTKVDKFNSKRAYKEYFNPHQTVGIGTTTGSSISLSYTIGETTNQISVPIQSIYIPNHQFITGDEVVLTKSDKPGISNLIVADNPNNLNTFFVPDVSTNKSTLYVINKSKDYIGLATQIGLTTYTDGIYFYNNGSDNPEYLLETNYERITGTINRILTKVNTNGEHGILNNDIIDLLVEPNNIVGLGTTSPISVKYETTSNKLLFNRVGFDSSQIDTVNNIITINSHGYETGDKVYYDSTDEVASGLSTGSYFIKKIDSNNFNLSETLYDIQPQNLNFVEISGVGTGSHNLSLINPEISVVRGSDLKFDLSDSSLRGYKFELFYDQEHKNKFLTTGEENDFNVIGIGTIGYEGSLFTLKYSNSLPSFLYYSLKDNSINHENIIDNEVNNFSRIKFVDSAYNGRHAVFGVSTSSFNISLTSEPKVFEVTSETSNVMKYSTNSPTVSGPINDCRVISKGINYKKLPKFNGVNSENGINANLVAISTSIGKIKEVRIIDPGYEYSSDKTLSPEALISSIIKLNNSDTISSINILYGGSEYLSPPNLILYDVVSDQVVDDNSFIAKVPTSRISDVEIVSPIQGLNSNQHRLISINNTNGVGIDSITSGSSGIVTCSLITPFVGFGTDIFNVGDQIYVEGIELQDTSNGTGYNSSDYQYRFFEVTSFINTNPAKLEYNLVDSNGVGLTTNPGIAKTFQSGYASIINSKNYPVFEVIQERDLFKEGEYLLVDDGNGFIESDLKVTSSRGEYIKTFGFTKLKNNFLIKGKNSGVSATIREIVRNSGRFKIDYSLKQNYGWKNNIGKLSEDFQVIPNNDYYQNLSYSIRSPITYDKFITPVNSIVHPAGLKNFADVGITSSSENNISIGATTNASVILDIFEEKRIDTINNFDLALDYDAKPLENKSKFLRVKNTNLTNYTKCLTNRVLLHDNISDKFSSKGESDLFTEIEVIDDNYARYLVQIIDPDTFDSQISDVVVITTQDNTFTLQRSELFTNEKLGDIIADSDSFSRETLRFTPTEQYDKDHDIKVLKNVFDTNSSGIGSISFGSVSLISSNIGVSSAPNNVSISTSTIFEYEASDFNCAFVNLQIQNTITKKINYVDIVLNFDGSQTEISEYYFDSDSVSYSINKIGIITSNYDSINGIISFNVENTLENPLFVRANSVSFKDISSGIGTYRFIISGQPKGSERSARLESVSEVGIGTLKAASLNVNNDTSLRSLVKVSCGQTSSLHQVLLVQDKTNIVTSQGPFVSNKTTTGIGTFGGERSGSNVYLNFYPDNEFLGESIEIQSYNEILYTESDFDNNPPELKYGTASQSILLSAYDGINGTRANKVDFDLNYQGKPIYSKTFNPNDSSQIDFVDGLFTINDHFFSTGEELIYTPDSTFIGVGKTAIGIGETANYLGILTDRLPTYVYPIVINSNQFKLSTRKDYANAGIYVTFTDPGIGNAHKLEMTKKLEKTVISLDGIVQQPITFTRISHTLQDNGGFIGVDTNRFVLSGISSIQPRDILKIDDEYMSVVEVGLSSSSGGQITGIINSSAINATSPSVSVKRGVVGSAVTTHIDGTNVQIYRGAFDIVGNKVYFTDPPKGNSRERRSVTNLPYVRAEYSGRTFLRSDYETNMIFDDISDQFTGLKKEYTLSVQGANTTGLSVGNGILFINGVFQTPTTENNLGNNYELIEDTTSGISSVVFTGITSTDGSFIKSEFDINQNQLPRGGLIVSLGSTPGLGYAPLVGAKVRADVDGSGTITNITGISHTGPAKSISTALYNNETGIIQITTDLDHQFNGGERIKLVGLGFTCESGVGIVSYFPLSDLDYAYDVTGIVSSRTFSAQVGVSTLKHYYIGMGTVFQWYDLTYGSGYRDPVSIAVTEYSHTGSGANITVNVGSGGTLGFTINDGGSGYSNPSINLPSPVYENIPVIGVSREGIGQTTDTGSNLLLNLNIGASSTTGIGSTYFQVSSFSISRPGYGFQVRDRIKPVGLVTAQGLTEPISEFTLEVVDVFSDSFSAWQFGELDYIDSIKPFQNGSRTVFPLYYNGELLSFEVDPADSLSSLIDLDSILIIFVNGVIQSPGYSYNFDGGTSFEFDRPPSPSDDIDIFFYVGDKNVDVEIVDVDETLKVGDDLRVYKNPNIPKTISQESNRTITYLKGSDILETDIYTGFGVDEQNYKPIEWNKQKTDLVINGENIYKSRPILSSQIYPTAKIIGDLNQTSSEIFVDNAQFFNYEENDYAISITTFDAVVFSGDSPVSAALTATVSIGGTIESITINNPGYGYNSNIPVSITNPKIIGVGVGSTAIANATVLNGSVSSINIIDGGFGYEQDNPPKVLVEIPSIDNEFIEDISNVQGFSGIITGITTTNGTSGHPLALKIFFKSDSSDANDLQSDYPISIFETNVGNGIISVNDSDSSIVGIGTTFLDNIYIIKSKVNNGSFGEFICNVHSSSSIIGINTFGSINDPVGKLSWGKIYNFTRGSNPISIGVTGLVVDSGLSTFPTIQRRTFGLRRTGAISIISNA